MRFAPAILTAASSREPEVTAARGRAPEQQARDSEECATWIGQRRTAGNASGDAEFAAELRQPSGGLVYAFTGPPANRGLNVGAALGTGSGFVTASPFPPDQSDATAFSDCMHARGNTTAR